ncbi:GtrA family protein [Tomitella biformata]|uniref:GtrA family protein n=1 Tax=Tomitella biformata TaxID=630403 RepID=UPI000466FDF2|nr:GtrA family protein [Tomitella biformata]
MSYADGVIRLIPEPFRGLALRHSEFIKFAIVGGTTFIFDLGIFYILKLSVMEAKPLTAKIIAGVAAMALSYYLNRQWSFRSRGGRGVSTEAVLFFVVSGIGVVLSFIPLWISRYWFHLDAMHHSLTVENIADFVSAYLIGNLLQMAFRFWALRRWVFPHEAPEQDHPQHLDDRDLETT